jgi:glycosyltransferase involved in cell wall biosynthesis
MNILITIGWPLGQGGHINSTLELIREIKKIDKEAMFYLLAPKGEKSKYFQDLNVKVFESQNHPNIYLYKFLYIIDVCHLMVKHQIDLIHCMDYKSLKPVTYLNLLFRKPIVFTKAGGPPSKNKIPSVSNFIVYSDELKDHYITSKLTLEQKQPRVIKARINTKNCIHQDGLKVEGCLKIFVAMRLKKEKKGLLDNLFSELSQIKNINQNVELNIAGGGELLSCYKKKADFITKNNNKIRVNFLGEITCNKTIDNYNSSSHLVVGHGRGILEPMAMGKAVVILGFNTLGSVLINSNNADRFSYHNFSGRNLKITKDDISLKELIASEDLENLLKNQNAKYISENYDSEIGARDTLKLYSESEKLNFKSLMLNMKWMLFNQVLLLTKFKKIVR